MLYRTNLIIQNITGQNTKETSFYIPCNNYLHRIKIHFSAEDSVDFFKLYFWFNQNNSYLDFFIAHYLTDHNNKPNSNTNHNHHVMITVPYDLTHHTIVTPEAVTTSDLKEEVHYFLSSLFISLFCRMMVKSALSTLSFSRSSISF